MDRHGRVSAARLLFRFGVGATELAGERLVATLHAVDALLPDSTGDGPDGQLGLHHALLGALASLPAWARAARARRQAARDAGRDRSARRRQLIARLPGARRARRRYRALLARTEAQLVRWALVGRREERAGRALAAHTITLAADELVSAVAESPQLKRVIAEQSESLGASAMGELREGSSRADALAERVARRLLRRSR